MILNAIKSLNEIGIDIYVNGISQERLKEMQLLLEPNPFYVEVDEDTSDVYGQVAVNGEKWLLRPLTVDCVYVYIPNLTEETEYAMKELSITMEASPHEVPQADGSIAIFTKFTHLG